MVHPGGIGALKQGTGTKNWEPGEVAVFTLSLQRQCLYLLVGMAIRGKVMSS